MYTVFRLKVEGIEDLPQHGPFLLCPNHSSYLDPLALAAALPWSILRQVYWAGSSNILFRSAWRRAFSRGARVLAVDPVLSIRTGLSQSAEVLRSGHVLVWFPEGWRSKDGQLQPFLPGIGALLLNSPVPVVPVYISGTFEAWPRQRRFPRPYPISVRFGCALDPRQWAGMAETREAEEQIALTIKEAVAASAH
jgi:long-chain acyl-CoA synthetase